MLSWIVPGTCQARATSIPGLRVDLRASFRTFSQSNAPFSCMEDPKLNSGNTPSSSDTPSIRSYLLTPHYSLRQATSSQHQHWMLNQSCTYHQTHTHDPWIFLSTQTQPLHLRSTMHAPTPPLALMSPSVAHLLSLSSIPPLTMLPKS